MSHIALTGANGFLGWHTRCAAAETRSAVRPIPLGVQHDEVFTAESISGASRVIHLAGVNRGNDDEVRDGNALFAKQIARSIACAAEPPRTVVFANSTQSVNGSVYGDAKAVASDMLREAAEKVGATYEDIVLPNLFGEHGLPFYNAVTATFCHLIANGERPSVDNDKELTLLHAQDAADLLLGGGHGLRQSELEVHETVSGVLKRLSEIDVVHRRGEIPDVAEKFNRDLFNTFRSYTFPQQTPVKLNRHADERGSFFEIVRSHGGDGQSSFSTTMPGISRGDHFHRRKVERFTVLAGTATIALRRLFTDEVFEFDVTGDEPVAVDMPTMWSHKITNTGTDVLYTSFWSNDIFNPDEPDTIAEAV